ncbi:hypothetical protein QOZ80_6AG0531680 [Eleusine coracana subsp. coracana]|nr:hypothetical protein QOZ80_6AG0531680 [Eleusine coracana subsp. coracana]
METAAAAMLEAGVGRFSRAPAMAAALLAEMWAPLAVVLAALATLPSLLRRLQVIVLRLRSRGKEVIQSHISTYYSSGDEDDEDEDDSSSDEASSSGDDDDDDEERERNSGMRRIGYLDDGAAGCFPWGGSVVRTWQGLPRRLSGCGFSLPGTGAGEGARLAAAGFPAVRLWGASTASGGEAWWSADEGASDGAAAEAEDLVVLGWRRDHARSRRRRALHAK